MEGHPAGLAVDAFGRQAFDPSKNVGDLVSAEARLRDALRNADNKYWDLDARRQDELNKAETRRLNDLADLRHQYDTQISENLRVQVKTTSELISTQLDKVTTSLSTQITTLTTAFSGQIAALTSALSSRIADVERFRWESGGKTSVTDPATNARLEELSAMVRGLTGTKSGGQAQVIAWLFAGIAAGAAIAVVMNAFMKDPEPRQNNIVRPGIIYAM